ncbi:MAG: hypothetical protein ACI38U_14250 [Corynebacterium sp.]|uniref:hypothetical protein n=1 Tax=Corynebacterium sp. TaxID=1720 RepID=UPI003EFE3B02
MTDEELHRILTDLTTHLKQMRDDRHGSSLNAPSGSGNGGKAPKGGKSKLPCSADLLNWEAELHFELSEPAEELHTDYPADCWPTPRMDPSRGTDSVAWVQWLNHPRHRPLILQKDWDLPTWLQEKESELRHMLHPTDPAPLAQKPVGERDHFATASRTAALLRQMGFSVDRKQVSYWETSGRLTGYLEDGETVYSLVEAQAVAAEYQNQRTI